MRTKLAALQDPRRGGLVAQPSRTQQKVGKRARVEHVPVSAGVNQSATVSEADVRNRPECAQMDLAKDLGVRQETRVRLGNVANDIS